MENQETGDVTPRTPRTPRLNLGYYGGVVVHGGFGNSITLLLGGSTALHQGLYCGEKIHGGIQTFIQDPNESETAGDDDVGKDTIGIGRDDTRAEEETEAELKPEEDVDQTPEDVDQTPEDVDQTPEDVDQTPDKTENELDQTQDLDQTQEDLEKTQEDLDQTQEDVAKTQEDVENTQEDLEQTQEDLEKTQEDVDQTQEDLEKTQEDLEQTQEDIEQTQEDLEQTQEDLEKTQEDVEQTQEDLDQTQEDLEKTQEDLEQTQEDLEQTQEDLDQTQEDLEQTQEDLDQTQEDLDQTQEDKQEQVDSDKAVQDTDEQDAHVQQTDDADLTAEEQEDDDQSVEVDQVQSSGQISSRSVPQEDVESKESEEDKSEEDKSEEDKSEESEVDQDTHEAAVVDDEPQRVGYRVSSDSQDGVEEVASETQENVEQESVPDADISRDTVPESEAQETDATADSGDDSKEEADEVSEASSAQMEEIRISGRTDNLDEDEDEFQEHDEEEDQFEVNSAISSEHVIEAISGNTMEDTEESDRPMESPAVGTLTESKKQPMGVDKFNLAPHPPQQDTQPQVVSVRSVDRMSDFDQADQRFRNNTSGVPPVGIIAKRVEAQTEQSARYSDDNSGYYAAPTKPAPTPTSLVSYTSSNPISASSTGSHLKDQSQTGRSVDAPVSQAPVYDAQPKWTSVAQTAAPIAAKVASSPAPYQQIGSSSTYTPASFLPTGVQQAYQQTAGNTYQQSSYKQTPFRQASGPPAQTINAYQTSAPSWQPSNTFQSSYQPTTTPYQPTTTTTPYQPTTTTPYQPTTTTIPYQSATTTPYQSTVTPFQQTTTAYQPTTTTTPYQQTTTPYQQYQQTTTAYQPTTTTTPYQPTTTTIPYQQTSTPYQQTTTPYQQTASSQYQAYQPSYPVAQPPTVQQMPNWTPAAYASVAPSVRQQSNPLATEWEAETPYRPQPADRSPFARQPLTGAAHLHGSHVRSPFNPVPQAVNRSSVQYDTLATVHESLDEEVHNKVSVQARGLALPNSRQYDTVSYSLSRPNLGLDEEVQQVSVQARGSALPNSAPMYLNTASARSMPQPSAQQPVYASGPETPRKLSQSPLMKPRGNITSQDARIEQSKFTFPNGKHLDLPERVFKPRSSGVRNRAVERSEKKTATHRNVTPEKQSVRQPSYVRSRQASKIVSEYESELSRHRDSVTHDDASSHVPNGIRSVSSSQDRYSQVGSDAESQATHTTISTKKRDVRCICC